MAGVELLAAVALIAFILWDGFETMVLPRTVSRRWRLARFYFRTVWSAWSAWGRRFGGDGARERFLAIYGPLSLLGMLLVWAVGLVLGFGLLHLAVGTHLTRQDGLRPTFVDDVYMSGTTFFTLGLGDLYPVGGIARFLTVAEAGTGFGFLALAIAYFPVLYQSFSRREARLTLLDAWAGSPPAAGEILRRLAEAREIDAVQPFLKDWEYWSSDVLESHISYPIVAFFRSQHQRQSWVAALASVLDISALVIAGIDGVPPWQARATFAIARHAAVDLTQVLGAHPDFRADRLSGDDLAQLRRELGDLGLRMNASPQADAILIELRQSYEPYVAGLGQRLMMPVPAWRHAGSVKDNWQTSPKRDGGLHF